MACFTPKKPVEPIYRWDRLVCHEVGHTLGLEHAGNGIMLNGLAPNAHDISSLQEWYGL